MQKDNEKDIEKQALLEQKEKIWRYETEKFDSKHSVSTKIQEEMKNLCWEKEELKGKLGRLESLKHKNLHW